MTSTQTTNDLPELEPGDHVIDRELEGDGPDPGIARVIEVYDTTANEHTVDKFNETVAALNPEYPPDDRVIAIKFISSLDGRPQGITYDYPRSRLKRHTDDENTRRMETEQNND